MEDVVLHYQPGSAAGLSSLLERTEKLLETFPCRIPPVFTPWYPTSTDHHLPIRPAKPAPVIACSDDFFCSDSRTHTPQIQPKKSEVDAAPAETSPEKPQEPKDVAFISETNDTLPEIEVPRLHLEKHKVVSSLTESLVKRSWSVFTQKGGLQSSQSLSKLFRHMVSLHRLHFHQRAKWVIRQHNCGATRDIEQVWRSLCRSVQSSMLPTCNANIQRERAEIWVFCDVVYSEQVGCLLKAELQLTGRIRLSVHRLENIFSM
ncbi:hypothetical protein PBY51_003547 [Eleginops maclovinus]|uniref:Shieldin complex subunit 3 n=1 Tax=Eleginops maclovinus TaxID=56733 RepID=A0AAN8AVL7_ELEMC|nr:hypothetical protein PBY51_003547 [Eleginops maclovinus]